MHALFNPQEPDITRFQLFKGTKRSCKIRLGVEFDCKLKINRERGVRSSASDDVPEMITVPEKNC